MFALTLQNSELWINTVCLWGFERVKVHENTGHSYTVYCKVYKSLIQIFVVIWQTAL